MPDIQAIDDLMDDLDEFYDDDDRYGTQIWKGFYLPLMAAYLRRSQKELDEERQKRTGNKEVEAPKENGRGKTKKVEAGAGLADEVSQQEEATA